MISNELKQFIKNNKDLLNENSKKSWEEIYQRLNNIRDHSHTGQFTETMLSTEIDPSEIMGQIPNYYLCRSKIANYEIPDNVISIGGCAFQSCHSLRSVVIGDRVTTIDYRAFFGCDSLTSVVIPDSVTSIGSEAFDNCNSLTSIEIPDSVATIGERVFWECDGLKEITFKGTKKQAIQLGIGNRSRKKWRENSSIEKIICTDGVIEL